MLSKRSLKLFHKAVKDVPAYKAFLHEHDLSPKQIKKPADLSRVPITSKKTYLVKNRLRDLVWSEDLKHPLLFCSTSGSTGDPYYFPRNERLGWQYSFLVEDYIKYSSYGRGPTLVLVAFGMGVWIGGVITLRAFEIAAERIKGPVSILPVGNNKVEVFKALRKLAPNFDQTIIVGYPPFVKDLVDEAQGEGINLRRHNIRFLFAAESFTETFRDYICRAVGIKDPLRDTLNIYGTADIGAMAFETPLSILTRRLIMNSDAELRKAIFRQVEKTPTLAQYNPDFIEFEEVNGEVVLTGNSALPLIRYAVGDHGGVFSYAAIRELMREYNLDLDQEIKKAGIERLINKEWPFVFVYERADFSVKLNAVIIYPEFVKEALLKPKLTPFFTGRFTMADKIDAHHNQFLQVNIELKKGVEPGLAIEQQALKIIHSTLLKKSSEFGDMIKAYPGKELIQIVLWPNGHPRYFVPGTKQKWVEKP